MCGAQARYRLESFQTSHTRAKRDDGRCVQLVHCGALIRGDAAAVLEHFVVNATYNASNFGVVFVVVLFIDIHDSFAKHRSAEKTINPIK